MKGKDIVLFGGLAAIAYLLISKKQSQQSDLLSGAGGAVQQALEAVKTGITSGAQNIADQFGNSLVSASGAYAGAVGTAYSFASPPAALGQTTPAQAQAFSNAFNTYVGGGAQLTGLNSTGTMINLNPALLSQGGVSQSGVLQGNAALVQNALSVAALNAGIGVASITPQAGGGVGTAFSSVFKSPASGPAASNDVSSWVSKVPTMTSPVPNVSSWVSKVR